MTKWICLFCGQVIPKYSLVSEHIISEHATNTAVLAKTEEEAAK